MRKKTHKKDKSTELLTEIDVDHMFKKSISTTTDKVVQTFEEEDTSQHDYTNLMVNVQGEESNDLTANSLTPFRNEENYNTNSKSLKKKDSADLTTIKDLRQKNQQIKLLDIINQNEKQMAANSNLHKKQGEDLKNIVSNRP